MDAKRLERLAAATTTRRAQTRATVAERKRLRALAGPKTSVPHRSPASDERAARLAGPGSDIRKMGLRKD